MQGGSATTAADAVDVGGNQLGAKGSAAALSNTIARNKRTLDAATTAWTEPLTVIEGAPSASATDIAAIDETTAIATDRLCVLLLSSDPSDARTYIRPASDSDDKKYTVKLTEEECERVERSAASAIPPRSFVPWSLAEKRRRCRLARGATEADAGRLALPPLVYDLDALLYRGGLRGFDGFFKDEPLSE